MGASIRWSLALRLGIAALGLAAIVLRSLDATGIWPQRGWVEFAVVVALGLVTFVEGVRAVVVQGREEGRAQVRARLQKVVVGALRAVAELRPAVDLAEVGGSVFVVRRRPLGREELHRVLRFRLDEHPQPTVVRWTRGKGTIGQAWEARTPQHVSWRAVAQRWGPPRALPTEQEFATIRASTRAGFTYEEFCGIVGKYAEVKAVPVVADDGRVTGVVSIDLPMTSTAPGLGTLLQGPDVEAVVIAAASLVGDVLA